VYPAELAESDPEICVFFNNCFRSFETCNIDLIKISARAWTCLSAEQRNKLPSKINEYFAEVNRCDLQPKFLSFD